VNPFVRQFLIIGAVGVIVFSVAQLVARNIYVTASIELAVVSATNDSLRSTQQTLVSRIAGLEAPGRLCELGTGLGLTPLPLESFVLMEVSE